MLRDEDAVLNYSFIRKGFKEHSDQVQSQELILRGSYFMSVFSEGLKHFERLKALTIEGSWSFASTLDVVQITCPGRFSGSPLARSWDYFRVRPVKYAG